MLSQIFWTAFLAGVRTAADLAEDRLLSLLLEREAETDRIRAREQAAGRAREEAVRHLHVTR